MTITNSARENDHEGSQSARCSISDVDIPHIFRICAVCGLRIVSGSRSLEWRCADARRKDGPWCAGFTPCSFCQWSFRKQYEQRICQSPRSFVKATWNRLRRQSREEVIFWNGGGLGERLAAMIRPLTSRTTSPTPAVVN